MKTVSNSDFEDLDGEYRLKKEPKEKIEDICIDGCIYIKVNDPYEDEFCFARQQIEKDPIIVCDINTGTALFICVHVSNFTDPL